MNEAALALRPASARAELAEAEFQELEALIQAREVGPAAAVPEDPPAAIPDDRSMAARMCDRLLGLPPGLRHAATRLAR